MDSPMEYVTTSMSRRDSFSSEASGSLKPTAGLRNRPDCPSELDNIESTVSITVDASIQNDSTPDPAKEEAVIHARAYQIEMFEESLKQNIIVAMETGSGKTQVAVLRIQAELEKSSDKIIWFLAPTIALCEQQFQVLKSQIGTAQIKILSSADNVDAWSESRVWDDYLKNVHIVVSTYQILLDAITHAFVQLGRLSLIVFDEAHNCTKKHPGSKIMERYRIHKQSGMLCPAILGLTASPIMGSRLDAIEDIEQTLNAVCKTPTVHREQLLAAVKRPVLSCISIPNSDDYIPTNSMTSLAKAFRSLDIYKDPYVLYLQREGSERSFSKLQKALERRETYCMKQMQSLCRRSAKVQQELGPWASNYFIYRAVTHFLDSATQSNIWFGSMVAEEKKYLTDVLRRVEIKLPQPLQDSTLEMSAKLILLIRELQSVPDGAIGIIFVRETTTVAILAHMLSEISSIKSRFRIGTMIGTSNYAARKRDLGEFDLAKDSLDLEAFRTGELNLLVATSVLEEGIDVPACNLVICFDPPSNLKSFIQRRGRARMRDSRLVLLLEGSFNQHNTWMTLEDDMKKRYEDDMRKVGELAEVEGWEGYPGVAPLHIPSTGARLDFDQAKSHLEHFCRKVTSRQYIDPRPYYITHHAKEYPDSLPKISATVILPASLPVAIRRVKGLRLWYSEKNACKDAAFQAFKEVYKAGLVNDNLMPLVDEILGGIETRSSLMEVNALWKPWQRVAQMWGRSSEVMQRELLLKDHDKVICRVDASLPCHFPRLPLFKIFWDRESTWVVETSERSNTVSTSALRDDQSAALIHLAYGHRWPVEDSRHILHLQSIENIIFRQHVGQRAVEGSTQNPEFLVRDMDKQPWVFSEWFPSRPPLELFKPLGKEVLDAPVNVPWLALEKWRRRQDFLHPDESTSEKGKRYILPVSLCALDTVDRSKAYFGAIIPSIVHMLEIYLTAEELCSTILAEVAFSNISLVVTAISSRVAGESTDYERLEFLGDSILKILTTVSVTVQYPHYPEGYLTAMKDRIVSNSRLCRASVVKGLDRFILTSRFTGRKWRPLYTKNLLSAEDTLAARRQMSTKMLADVVESLIGAAFEDGGMAKALTCLRIFLPEVEWYDLIDAQPILFDRKHITTQLPAILEPLEELIGHTFRNKTLLMEAVTHASWGLSTSTEICMERLEFLGDSILDNVVVSMLWTYERELSNNEMHLLRTASVNADLLGFLVMEWCISQETTSISADLTTIVSQTALPFWKFMRHNSSQVSVAQRAAEERHSAERGAILNAIAHSTEYPWAQLAHLNLPKFFSDMVESVIGAVWVDTGSIDSCKEIVERIGILPYLRRMLSDNVDAKHPKNKLGELVARDGRKVKYETEVRAKTGVQNLCCRVYIDEQFVMEIGGGVNPDEVVTKAADEAYKLLSRGKVTEDKMVMTD